ncbi:hypothetical protein CMV_025049 [Castanea mollissima]|uniref:Uncharacterized protein n=1 Tax=Castanea mollissima TaxID=60419 RepID=A0A8J4QGV0_9ROSI|nr:hypothetical protein CMV_025049 [Castanea mollissima]
MRLTCNQFDQFVGRLLFETLVSGSVIKQQYTLCSKSQLFDQPLCYSLMMDGCIHDGLISNTQEYIDLLDSGCGDHIS